jgi:hypothetical protein
MERKLTLQTEAAFERIHQSLMGETDDDLSVLSHHLEKLIAKAKEIQDITAQINHMDGF